MHINRFRQPVRAVTRALSEPLEARRLLSAAALLGDGTLLVTGSARPDRIIAFSKVGFDGVPRIGVTIADDSRRPPMEYAFPAAQVRFVVVRSGAGADEISLSLDQYPSPPGRGEESSVTVPSRIDGGLGDDLLYGGTARDYLFGSFGNDEIHGLGGDDWIDGGWGNDRLFGGDGNDYLSGSYGNDSVVGDEGNDRLYGGPGNDHVGSVGGGTQFPEPGNDLLAGGTGEDWMCGGLGADRVSGGAGRDHFSVYDVNRYEIFDRASDEPMDVPVLAGAGYVTFAFRGTVNSVTNPRDGIPPGSSPVDWPAPGTTFEGTYTFDPANPGFHDSNSTAVSYTTYPNAPVAVTIGDFRWTSGRSAVAVFDSPRGFDEYRAGDASLQLANHPELAAFYDRWNFVLNVSGGGEIVSSAALPLVPPSLDRATDKTLTLTGDWSQNLSPWPIVVISASLDSLTLVA